MTDDVGGIKSTELWLTTITGVVEIILVSTAPSSTTIVISVCLTTAAAVYLICRTCFKIAKLKYAPDSAVEFSVQNTSKTTKQAIID